jgi:hypothetical protein
MSLSQVPLECVNVLDPLIDVEDKKEFFVIKSGSQQTYYIYPTSSFSSSSVQFGAANPPSAMTIVNRKVYMEFPIRIYLSAVNGRGNNAIVGVPQGNTVLRQNYDSLRAFPLSNVIDTLTVTINNQAATINLADITQAMLRYNTDQELCEGLYSQTPTYMDTWCSYTAGNGANNNPMAAYDTPVEGGVTNRGGFSGYRIVFNESVNAGGNIADPNSPRNGQAILNGAPLYACVDCFLCEPIFMSPFFFGKGQSQGFYSVSNMNFNFTFIGQQQMATRMWSHDDGTNGTGGTAGTANYPVSGISASFPLLAQLPFAGNTPPFTTFTNGSNISQPRLTFQYLTPLDNMPLPMEKPITYPYNVVIRYPFTQASNIAAYNPAVGPQFNQILSQSLQLTTVPRRIYIWASEDVSTLYNNTAATDTFFAIQNLSVQFQNKNGQLASASQNQLYQISKKNGCNMNFSQWSGNQVPIDQAGTNWGEATSGTIGSVLCLELATDLGLPSDMAPGLMTQSLLQVTCQISNIQQRAILPRLYVVTVQEGSWVIQNKASFASVGVLTVEDIKKANERPHYNMRDVEDVNGGNFLTGLKNFFGKVGEFLKKHSLVSKIASAIPHPLAQKVGLAAKAIGYGHHDDMMGYGHEMRALPYYGEGVSAGWDNPDLVGQVGHPLLAGVHAGKKMSHKELARRIMY